MGCVVKLGLLALHYRYLAEKITRDSRMLDGCTGEDEYGPLVGLPWYHGCFYNPLHIIIQREYAITGRIRIWVGVRQRAEKSNIGPEPASGIPESLINLELRNWKKAKNLTY